MEVKPNPNLTRKEHVACTVESYKQKMEIDKLKVRTKEGWISDTVEVKPIDQQTGQGQDVGHSPKADQHWHRHGTRGPEGMENGR